MRKTRIAALITSSVGVSISPIMRGGLGLAIDRLDLGPVTVSYTHLTLPTNREV